MSLSRVFELAQSCALHGSSLPVVSALCHSWLHRARSRQSPDQCVEPVAAALKELLPAPIAGALETWGIQPHQSSSGWMSTWRVWRAVASALNMSGVLNPPPANHVTCTHRAIPLSPCFSNRIQGCKFGEFSPSNVAFACLPLPRSCSAPAPLFPSLLEPRPLDTSAAAMPTQAPALSSPHKIKQEDIMQDDDVAPLQPAAAADAKLSGGDSLASLLAACPPSLHTGIVESVCRCVWHRARACLRR